MLVSVASYWGCNSLTQLSIGKSLAALRLTCFPVDFQRTFHISLSTPDWQCANNPWQCLALQSLCLVWTIVSDLRAQIRLQNMQLHDKSNCIFISNLISTCKMLFCYDIIYAVCSASCGKKCRSEHQTLLSVFRRVWEWDNKSRHQTQLFW